MSRRRMLACVSVSLVAAALLTAGNAVAQLYQVRAEYGMWDTWLMKDRNDYHLFFLQRRLTNIGRAVSKDLDSWTPLPDIDTKAAPGHWDSDRAKTGMCDIRSNHGCYFGNSDVSDIHRHG